MNIRKSIIWVLLSVFTLTACNDILDVDSDRQVFENEYDMGMANDSLYSMFGVLSQLQKLADNYTLLGELRGDLINVTPKADQSLNEINVNNISYGKNKYINDIKDYYAVINNCNYIIHKIDTAAVSKGEKAMLKEYAALKAVRAWTFMQIALNFGEVRYYDKPILTIEDAESVQAQTPLTMEQLAPILIADLVPYTNVGTPVLGTLNGANLRYAIFRVGMVLGDLYLWSGQYENAATEYYRLIYNNKYVISKYNTWSFQVTNGAFTGGVIITTDGTVESMTNIYSSNRDANYFKMDSLAYGQRIIPSDTAINSWLSQKYYYSSALDTVTDLRINKYVSLKTYSSSTRWVSTETNNYIYWFLNGNGLGAAVNASKTSNVYRVPLVYLRYAEAVNRLGKPNMAMAVLKYGLSASTLANRKYIPGSEFGDVMPAYMNFTDARFDNNIGIHMRGCGNSNQDTTYYRIPRIAGMSKSDSIVYVEDLIEQELRLETAFQGNRFQDLMRFAIRRNDNMYLANKIAAKFKDPVTAADVRQRLSTRANWYLKR